MQTDLYYNCLLRPSLHCNELTALVGCLKSHFGGHKILYGFKGAVEST